MQNHIESAGKPRAGFVLPLLFVILWCALPGLCLYCNNAVEMPFHDILLPSGCSVLIGVLCFFLLLAVFRDADFAALTAFAGMAVFLNFNLVTDLVNMIHPVERMRPYYVTAAVLFAAAFLILLWIKKKPGWCRTVVRLLLLAMASTLVLSLIPAVPSIARKMNTTAHRPAEIAVAEGTVMPNLYYLVTDEYASFDQIAEYYDYDNSAFHDFLTENGFCVSDTSYNRYWYTMANLTEAVNLAPVVTDKEDSIGQAAQFENAALYGALKGMGYDICQIGNLFPFPTLIPYFQSHVTAENGAAAMEILMTNSMLKPFSLQLYWNSVLDSRTRSFEYFTNPAHYTTRHNRALLYYVCSPHIPYYCNADGERNQNQSDWTNRADPRFYLGQYRYMTTQLVRMISSILANDPDAIILLQSDHGQREGMNFSDSAKRHILNALYFGGKPVDITGLSGYNTWRKLLSELGGDYPLLPEDFEK